MFKETKEGQTHYYGDNCGEPAHNQPMNNLNKELDRLVRDFTTAIPKSKSKVREEILCFTRSVIEQAMPEEKERPQGDNDREIHLALGFNACLAQFKQNFERILNNTEDKKIECFRCNDNGCPACDGTKGSSYNPEPY